MPRKKLSYGKRDKCTTERPAVFGVKRFNGKETGWKDNGPPIETIGFFSLFPLAFRKFP